MGILLLAEVGPYSESQHSGGKVTLLLLSVSVERWVAIHTTITQETVSRGSTGVINVYPAYLEVI